jgi:hypothetical protein
VFYTVFFSFGLMKYQNNTLFNQKKYFKNGDFKDRKKASRVKEDKKMER